MATALAATAVPASAATMSTDDAVRAVKRHAIAERAALGVTRGDVRRAVVGDAYTSRGGRLTHVHLRQHVDGVPIYNALLTATVTRSGRVVHARSTFVRGAHAAADARTPEIGAAAAVSDAARALGVKVVDVSPARRHASGRFVTTAVVEGRSRRIEAVLEYQPVRRNSLRLVWRFDLEADGQRWFDVSVDAVSGRLLRADNRYEHTSTDATVYALPAESPNHVGDGLPLPPEDGRTLVDTAAAANGTASPHGWHDLDGRPGADTLDTTGINVFAQTDVDATNVFTPVVDTRPLALDRHFRPALDLSKEPADYRDAAVTNLFYWNNVNHDLHFLYGFDEAAGNFQLINRTRQGLPADAVEADAQDGSGTNNANFGTPPDGRAPRMQMFVWTGRPVLRVNAPADIADEYPAAPAAFGAKLDTTGVTGDLELVNDGTAAPSQGCGPLQGFTRGRVAVIDRGGCEFGLKVKNAEDAGAIAAVIVNNQGDGLVTMAPGATGNQVTIASVFVGQSSGERIKGAGALVNATMLKKFNDRDSDFDNGVIAHEYGHGVSNRLTGGPSTTSCLRNEQQGGEGWSDWWALVFTQRPGATGEEPRGIGTYLTFEDDPSTARGIRPYPYSTDLAINPQTYDDIAEVNATGQPVLSVPHGVGSVWATTLWEMYWTLVRGNKEFKLRKAGFRADLQDLSRKPAGNQIALQLVMDGLKMQKCSPSFLDARDAILAAARTRFDGAYECHVWFAFAKRGMGENAYDGDGPTGGGVNKDVVEDFTMPSSCQPKGKRAGGPRKARRGEAFAQAPRRR